MWSPWASGRTRTVAHLPLTRKPKVQGTSAGGPSAPLRSPTSTRHTTPCAARGRLLGPTTHRGRCAIRSTVATAHRAPPGATTRPSYLGLPDPDSRSTQPDSGCAVLAGFLSVCEHHLPPFTGVAHVGYLPGRRLVGLSTLTTVIEHVARYRARHGEPDQHGSERHRLARAGNHHMPASGSPRQRDHRWR